MCGIAGIFSLQEKISPQWIKTMAERIRHRGPDDEGYLGIDTRAGKVTQWGGKDSKVTLPSIDSVKDSNINLFLGHRRLSILDISPAGHQPMANSDKTLWIIYNGEIYNYLELKKELESHGYAFSTGTDTEVLLAAYQQWGDRVLEKLDGMWSFVIYDKRKNRLFGARDRFGVKPFYYYNKGPFFAFASEIKALVHLPFYKRELNNDALFDFLMYGFEERNEQGVFKDIFELQPAFSFYLDLKTGEFEKQQYYQLEYEPGWERKVEKNMDKVSTRVKELIFDSVKKRLQADVPIGSCLSGGIDSSTIVCAINNFISEEPITQIGDRQKVFTASYEVESIDESKWASLVVNQTKTDWFQTYPTAEELYKDLEDLVYIQDIPFSSTSLYAQYRVMKLASEQHMKVMLDGQGGDELFTGYTLYYDVFFLDMLKHMDLGRFLKEWRGLNNAPVSRSFLSKALIKRFGKILLPETFKQVYRKRKTRENIYFNPDFLQMFGKRYKDIYEREMVSLNKMLHRFYFVDHLKPLLKYEDRNSMRFGIEARTPFSDDINLVEYVFKLPASYKIYRGWSKYLLRQSMKGILPEEIRLRKDKIGFATPEGYWLGQLKDRLKEYITDDVGDILDIGKIRQDWDRLITSQGQTGITDLWRLICFMVWKKVYGV